MAAEVLEKKQAPKVKEQKPIMFELFPSDEKLVPMDENNVRRAPYPPFRTVPNGGDAINPKTNQMERFRYVHSYQQSIWVSEQPTNLTKEQLSDPRNDLVFRRGKLMVQPWEKAKLACLTIQDGYDKCKDPINPSKPKLFFKIDQVEFSKNLLEDLDLAYEAEKKAREMTVEDMYAIASLYAVDLDQPDTVIRTQLILKAKQHPKTFLREFVDPKNKVRFLFLRALQENIISASKVPGFIVMVETGVSLFKITEGADAADDMARMWAAQDKDAVKLQKALESALAS